MAEPTPAQVAIRDPLSEVTRNERRFLLGVSIIAIALVRTGLVPSKISALGIEFSQTDQKSLLFVLALVTSYFVAAFLLYAGSDFVAWRLAFRAAVNEWVEQTKKRDEDRARRIALGQEDSRHPVEAYSERFARSRIISRIARPTSFLRATFDFLLPLIVGIYATILLLRTHPPLQQEKYNTPIVHLSENFITLDSDTPIRLLQ
jgi:hypothetical protein